MLTELFVVASPVFWGQVGGQGLPFGQEAA